MHRQDLFVWTKLDDDDDDIDIDIDIGEYKSTRISQQYLDFIVSGLLTTVGTRTSLRTKFSKRLIRTYNNVIIYLFDADFYKISLLKKI